MIVYYAQKHLIVDCFEFKSLCNLIDIGACSLRLTTSVQTVANSTTSKTIKEIMTTENDTLTARF